MSSDPDPTAARAYLAIFAASAISRLTASPRRSTSPIFSAAHCAFAAACTTYARRNASRPASTAARNASSCFASAAASASATASAVAAALVSSRARSKRSMCASSSETVSVSASIFARCAEDMACIETSSLFAEEACASADSRARASSARCDCASASFSARSERSASACALDAALASSSRDKQRARRLASSIASCLDEPASFSRSAGASASSTAGGRGWLGASSRGSSLSPVVPDSSSLLLSLDESSAGAGSTGSASASATAGASALAAGAATEAAAGGFFTVFPFFPIRAGGARRRVPIGAIVAPHRRAGKLVVTRSFVIL